MCLTTTYARTSYLLCPHLDVERVVHTRCNNDYCASGQTHNPNCTYGFLESCSRCRRIGHACPIHHRCQHIHATNIITREQRMGHCGCGWRQGAKWLFWRLLVIIQLIPLFKVTSCIKTLTIRIPDFIHSLKLQIWTDPFRFCYFPIISPLIRLPSFRELYKHMQ